MPPLEIFIAEDNPADVALVREALKLSDVDCVLHVLRDGEQALALLDSLDRDPKTPRADLLILDMHLPKYDGEEILKRLRATKNYAHTPVIMMTSQASTWIEEQATKHAALFHSRKPSTMEELTTLGRVVRNMLEEVGRGTGNPLPSQRPAGGDR